MKSSVLPYDKIDGCLSLFPSMHTYTLSRQEKKLVWTNNLFLRGYICTLKKNLVVQVDLFKWIFGTELVILTNSTIPCHVPRDRRSSSVVPHRTSCEGQDNDHRVDVRLQLETGEVSQSHLSLDRCLWIFAP